MKIIFKFFITILCLSNTIQSMQKIKAKLKRKSIDQNIKIERVDSESVQCRQPGALSDPTPVQQHHIPATQDKSKTTNNLKNDANIPFFKIIKTGNAQQVFVFINDKNNKTDVNLQDSNGDTALHHLVRNLPILSNNMTENDLANDRKTKEIMRVLLVHGANPNIANNKSETPEGLATERNRPDLFKVLQLGAQTRQFIKKYPNKNKKPKPKYKTESQILTQNKIKKYIFISALGIGTVLLIYKFLNKNSKEK